MIFKWICIFRRIIVGRIENRHPNQTPEEHFQHHLKNNTLLWLFFLIFFAINLGRWLCLNYNRFDADVCNVQLRVFGWTLNERRWQKWAKKKQKLSRNSIDISHWWFPSNRFNFCGKSLIGYSVKEKFRNFDQAPRKCDISKCRPNDLQKFCPKMGESFCSPHRRTHQNDGLFVS